MSSETGDGVHYSTVVLEGVEQVLINQLVEIGSIFDVILFDFI